MRRKSKEPFVYQLWNGLDKPWTLSRQTKLTAVDCMATIFCSVVTSGCPVSGNSQTDDDNVSATQLSEASTGLQFIRLSDKYPVLLGPAIYSAAVLDGVSHERTGVFSQQYDKQPAAGQLTTLTLEPRVSHVAPIGKCCLPSL